MSVILDASALLAFLNGEPGGNVVEARMTEGAVMSSVNLAEVVTKLNAGGMPLSEVKATVSDLDLHVVPFDETLAYLTGELWKLTKNGGLSLADRACLALGMNDTSNRTVLTADRAWAAASHLPGLTIEQIR